MAGHFTPGRLVPVAAVEPQAVCERILRRFPLGFTAAELAKRTRFRQQPTPHHVVVRNGNAVDAGLRRGDDCGLLLAIARERV